VSHVVVLADAVFPLCVHVHVRTGVMQIFI